MTTALQGTASAANAIQRVRYSHDAMIELLMMEPGISQNKIAAYFGFTVGWVSRVMNSDAFQARLAERKTELIDPTIKQSFEDRLKGLANQSLDIVMQKLDAAPTFDSGLKALELSTRALGFGARAAAAPGAQTVNFVVALPSKTEDQAEWAASAISKLAPMPVIQDVTPKAI